MRSISNKRPVDPIILSIPDLEKVLNFARKPKTDGVHRRVATETIVLVIEFQRALNFKQ